MLIGLFITIYFRWRSNKANKPHIKIGLPNHHYLYIEVQTNKIPLVAFNRIKIKRGKFKLKQKRSFSQTRPNNEAQELNLANEKSESEVTINQAGGFYLYLKENENKYGLKLFFYTSAGRVIKKYKPQ